MPFGLESIADFINSPPGQLAAGVALGGIVIAWFKRVGDVLKDETNQEIARWIKVRNVEAGMIAGEAESWPGTFAKVFDRVFGEKHLSWKCFWRSCLATTASCTLCSLVSRAVWRGLPAESAFLGQVLEAAVLLMLLDYLSLLETRWLLLLATRFSSPKWLSAILLADLMLSGLIGSPPVGFVLRVLEGHRIVAATTLKLGNLDAALRTLGSDLSGRPLRLNFQYDAVSHLPELAEKAAGLRQYASVLERQLGQLRASAVGDDSRVTRLDNELKKARHELEVAEALLMSRLRPKADAVFAPTMPAEDASQFLGSFENQRKESVVAFWGPAFFTSIWLWLYAASGFALKAAKRFDLGFYWFNSHFDIDKKPLQSMGVVAGVLVAVLYWGVALGWYAFRALS